MPHYDITASRDGRWWMVYIPALGAYTQARCPTEIEDMAREYIAVDTDTPIADIHVTLR